MDRHFKFTLLSVSISYIIFARFEQSVAYIEHDFKEAVIDSGESPGNYVIYVLPTVFANFLL